MNSGKRLRKLGLNQDRMTDWERSQLLQNALLIRVNNLSVGAL